MDIVACTDKWFVMPTGVMMYSVCVNNPDVDIVFHVIHDDSVTDLEKKDLEETTSSFSGKSILFYAVDISVFPSFPKVYENSRVTQTTYYRLLLSEILPVTMKKVLYLDGDIIVRHSLIDLWNTDINDYAIAAVPDMSEGIIDFYNRLCFPPQYGYFNAGVLLVNLDYWREHRVFSLFRCYLIEHAFSILYNDQDVLNVLFYDKTKKLPIKYNMQNGFLWKNPRYDYWKYEKEVLEARKDPVIVHLMGEKPWTAYRRHPIHPFASTFFKYQKQTKWNGMTIERRAFKLRVINYIADLLRKYGLKSQLPPLSPEYIDIAPLE